MRACRPKHADPKDVKRRKRERERESTWERESRRVGERESRGIGEKEGKESRREAPGPLAPLSICFFLLPLACPM